MPSHVAILVAMRGRYPPCNKTIKWQSKDIKPTDEAACLRIYPRHQSGFRKRPGCRELAGCIGAHAFRGHAYGEIGTGVSVDRQGLVGGMAQVWSRHIRLRRPRTKHESQHKSLLRAAWSSGILMPLPSLLSFPCYQQEQRKRIGEEARKQILASCCQFVLAHACRVNDPTYPKNPKALAAEDTNIQSVLFGSPPSPLIVLPDKAMEALIAFGWHRCDTRPNLEIANHAVTVAKATGVVRYITSAVWCLGQTHAQLGFSTWGGRVATAWRPMWN